MTTLDPVYLSRLTHEVGEESDYQKTIQKARDYHRGEQFTALTERLRQFLNVDKDVDFVLNVAAIVVRATRERLKLTGFSTDEPEITQPDGSTLKPQAAQFWQWWQQNRMDAHADEVHLWALRDSEAMLLVDYDVVNGRPRFTPHRRYVDPTFDGDGEGMRVFYVDDNPATGQIAYATKRWTQVEYVRDDLLRGTTSAAIKRVLTPRLTIYYPDRIERYSLPTNSGGQWRLLDDNGIVSWRDPAGRPLGVPVVHFRNAEEMCEASPAWPIQDAINKTLIDLIAAGDVSAFRLLVAIGWMPTTDGQPPASDGSNRLSLQPGQIIGTLNPNAKGLEVVEGADLQGLIDAMMALIQWLAMVTDTPMSRFTTTKQVAAEGTLKQQEGPLVSKIENRQVLFGNAWEDAMTIARRLANAFGSAALDETVIAQAQWAPAATRDEAAEIARAEAKQRLGVPQEQIWSELGYSQQQIAQFVEQREAREQQERDLAEAAAAARPQGAGITRSRNV